MVCRDLAPASSSRVENGGFAEGKYNWIIIRAAHAALVFSELRRACAIIHDKNDAGEVSLLPRKILLSGNNHYFLILSILKFILTLKIKCRIVLMFKLNFFPFH